MNNPPSLADSPPFQYNYDKRSSTVFWSGSDHERHYKENVRNPQKHKELKDLGWLDTVIEYKYNSHGFRCEEFDSRPSVLALGCSFTEGTGLPIEQTWPGCLSQMLNTHVWNLGSGGASVDTVFRLLNHYIQRLNVQCVFILIPPEGRFEFQNTEGGFPIIQACDLGMHPSFAKEWLTQTNNGKYNQRKTMLAIQQLCKNHNKPLYAYNCDQTELLREQLGQIGVFYDMARDLMHPGPYYQQWIAETMHELFKNQQEYHCE
jgi:hypothetical protein